MGVDTVIKLLPQTTLRDVAQVIGVALGCKANEIPLGDPGEGIYSSVQGVKTTPSSVETLSEISIHNVKSFLYHFEFGKDGHRGLMPRSRPLNICVGRRLIDHFGGELEYQDCACSGPDEKNENPDTFINADDGEDWNKRQRKILETPVITEDEVREAAKVASYNDPSTIEDDIEILRQIKERN